MANKDGSKSFLKLVLNKNNDVNKKLTQNYIEYNNDAELNNNLLTIPLSISLSGYYRPAAGNYTRLQYGIFKSKRAYSQIVAYYSSFTKKSSVYNVESGSDPKSYGHSVRRVAK